MGLVSQKVMQPTTTRQIRRGWPKNGSPWNKGLAEMEESVDSGYELK
jgi:hypothetical protein